MYLGEGYTGAHFIHFITFTLQETNEKLERERNLESLWNAVIAQEEGWDSRKEDYCLKNVVRRLGHSVPLLYLR